MKRVLCSCALLALAACGDDGPRYAGLEFDVISAPPVPVSVTNNAIDISAGISVKVEVTPLSSEDRYTNRHQLDLRPRNLDVLAVYLTEDPRNFVLVGVRPGETCLDVLINRDEQECIPVRVR